MWARAVPAAAKLLSGPAYRRFTRKLANPAQAQARLLDELVAGMAPSAYGRRLGLRPGDGYRAFRDKVPVSDYAALKPWIERWRAGEHGVLTTERALFWQKTSGSGGPEKWIPCTPGLLGSFRRMFSAWLGDVLRHGPRFETGRLFVGLSPAARGLDANAPQSEPEYLGRGLRGLLAPLITPPASLLALSRPESFRRALRLALLARAESLEALSVWNPTAFTVILDDISENRAAVLEDCRRGALRLEGLDFRFGRPAPATLAALGASDLRWDAVFPHLKFISCWTEAWARPAALRLGALFPAALLQGKGLLATEAPMTIPLLGAVGAVPLVDEVFFEFEEAAGRVVPLSEIEPGGEYALLVSTRGGLYRYRIGDRVRCAGRRLATPTLEFTGRADGTADLVGEKLEESFVASALSELGLAAEDFKTLVPVRAGRGPSYYLLWLGRERADAPELARALDERLSRSHRYRQAREMGQLAQPLVVGRSDAERRYLAYLVARGMRLGDIKSRSLLRQPLHDHELNRFVQEAA